MSDETPPQTDVSIAYGFKRLDVFHDDLYACMKCGAVLHFWGDHPQVCPAMKRRPQ